MNGSLLLSLPLLVLSLCTVRAQAQLTSTSDSKTGKPAYDIPPKIPISNGFLENRGQWDSRARFLAQTDGLDIWVTDGAIVYDRHEIASNDSGQERHGHVVRMSFGGGGTTAGLAPQSGHYNFLIGNDPADWTTGVRRYATVEMKRLYDGIDAVLYFDGNMPRYDLHVAAGADPSHIRIRYDGAEYTRVASGDTLMLGTSLGEIRQTGLVAYQQIGETVRRIECSFRPHDDGTVGFAIGTYDRTRPLVIDPLLYSTYLGTPTGTQGRTEIRSIAVDRDGNAFVTGANTIGTVPYPTTTGAYRSQHYGGGFDLFVTKLSPGGDSLIYSTFLGGNGSDEGNAIAVDTVGFAYVAGNTSSDNFPVTAGSYQTTRGETATYTGFITKLNFDGTGLAYSTYINDVYCTALAVDNAKNAYVTGPALVGFTTIPTAYQATYGKGNTDAYVLKLNSAGTGVGYATFVGGAGNDIGVAIAVDASFNAYITGNTNSGTFPTTQGAYQTILNGTNEDYFVTKVNPDGKGIAYSTMIGGTDYDKSLGIAVDKNGAAYITGNTRSADYPTTAGAYQGTYGGQDNLKRYGDAFVTKLSANGTTLVYSTLLGSTSGDRGTAIATDRLGNAYVAGATVSSGFPTTTNAYRTVIAGNYDAFFAKLSSDGTQLGYSTFIGGTRADSATGIALDGNGGTYVAGFTLSSNYPVTTKAYQRTYGGTSNGFISKFSAIRVTIPNGNDRWCAGTNQTISWDAIGAGMVDIYLSSDGGATYDRIAQNVSGTSHEWKIPLAQKGGSAYRIRIVEQGTEFSDVGDGTFTIDPYPSIATQPKDLVKNAGDSAVFTASLIGPASVQWQVSSDGGINWSEIPGATDTTLVLRNLQTSQTRTVYRAVFTNQCATIAGDSALLTVVSLTFAKPSAEETLCPGETLTLLWNLTGFVGAPSGYDLEYSSDSGASWNPIDAAISTNSYSWTIPAGLPPGSTYRIRVRLRNTDVVAVTDKNLTLGALPSVSTDPTDVTGNAGTNAQFVAVAEGGVTADGVQWQASSDGQNWNTLPTDAQSVEQFGEGTRTTLDVTDLKSDDDGNRYRAIFTNGCGADTSAPGTLHVTSQPTGVDDPSFAGGTLSIAVEPNPSRGAATVRMELPHDAHARVEVVDATGRIVRSIDIGSPDAGEHLLPIDLSDMPSGAYTCILRAGSEQRSVKMTVVH